MQPNPSTTALEPVKLVHSSKICHLTTRCLFYISCCDKYVIQPPFCFTVTYKNSTPNDHGHKGFFSLLTMHTQLHKSSMKCLSFASIAPIKDLTYVNTVVELAKYSSEICPSVMDVVFALGEGICFPGFHAATFT